MWGDCSRSSRSEVVRDVADLGVRLPQRSDVTSLLPQSDFNSIHGPQIATLTMRSSFASRRPKARKIEADEEEEKAEDDDSLGKPSTYSHRSHLKFDPLSSRNPLPDQLHPAQNLQKINAPLSGSPSAPRQEPPPALTLLPTTKPPSY